MAGTGSSAMAENCILKFPASKPALPGGHMRTIGKSVPAGKHHVFFRRIIGILLLLSPAAVAQIDTINPHFYAFVYFKMNQKTGAHLALSTDGLVWEILNNDEPVLRVDSTKGEGAMQYPATCRDPRSGLYHMVWSTSWFSTAIKHSTSRDLLTWETPEIISLAINEDSIASYQCPELFFDSAANSFVLHWTGMSNARNVKDKIWYSQTSDFKTFTPPAVLFSPGFNVFSSTLFKVSDNRYFLFFGDDEMRSMSAPNQRAVRFIYGPTPLGPWSAPSNIITRIATNGPSAIKINNEYRVYFDPYLDSTRLDRMVKNHSIDDTSSSWIAGDTLKTVDGGNFLYSKGTILEIPRATALALLSAKDPLSVTTPKTVIEPDPASPEKRNCGCGTGVGLAFIPPLLFRVRTGLRRRNKQNL
jgi:hypothetical protein